MCSLLPPCVLLCVSLVLRARDCEWSDRSRDCWTDHLGGRRFLHAGAYHHLLHSGAQQRLCAHLGSVSLQPHFCLLLLSIQLSLRQCMHSSAVHHIIFRVMLWQGFSGIFLHPTLAAIDTLAWVPCLFYMWPGEPVTRSVWLLVGFSHICKLERTAHGFSVLVVSVPSLCGGCCALYSG